MRRTGIIMINLAGKYVFWEQLNFLFQPLRKTKLAKIPVFLVHMPIILVNIVRDKLEDKTPYINTCHSVELHMSM